MWAILKIKCLSWKIEVTLGRENFPNSVSGTLEIDWQYTLANMKSIDQLEEISIDNGQLVFIYRVDDCLQSVCIPL
jgi:hypothetical protein